jgi:hypothetical protein
MCVHARGAGIWGFVGLSGQVSASGLGLTGPCRSWRRGCEGTHTDGRVGDGLVGPPRRGYTTGIDLGYAPIPQGRFLAECSAAVTGTEETEGVE